MMPTNFVKVIPLRTELPMRASESCARSILLCSGLTLNALATCAQNSTDIPMAMMRLTRDTALREIPQMLIKPSKLTTIIATTTVMITAIPKLNPSKIKVTTKIAPEKEENGLFNGIRGLYLLKSKLHSVTLACKKSSVNNWNTFITKSTVSISTTFGWCKVNVY